MSKIPEIACALSFLSSGITDGLLLYHTLFSYMYGTKSAWISVGKISGALGTCLILIFPKMKFKTLQFHHVHLLLLASALQLCAGTTLNQKLPSIMFYLLTGAAHGITFIAVPSYLTFRSKPETRNCTLSFGMSTYFVGMALIVVLQGIQIEHLETVIIVSATVVTFILLCLLFVESAFDKNRWSYSCTLDPLIEVVDKSKLLFASKKAIVNDISPQVRMNPSEAGHNCLSVMLVLTRINGWLIFATPLLVALHENQRNVIGDASLRWISIAFAVGAVIGTICARSIFYSFIYFPCGVISIITSITMLTLWSTQLTIVSTVYGFTLGINYYVNHAAVMETAKFKYTEVMLFAGYSLEVIAATVLHIFILYEYQYFEDISPIFNIIGCLLLSSGLLAIASFLPSSFGESIIVVRDELMDIETYRRMARTAENPPPYWTVVDH